MTVLFQASELHDWATITEITPGNITDYTGGGTYNASNSRGSIGVPASNTEYGNTVISHPFSSDEFWVSANVYTSAINANAYKWLMLNGSGTRRIALAESGVNTSMIRAFKWNGSSWDTIATGAAGTMMNGIQKYDLYVKLGNPGILRLYRDGVAVIAEVPDLSFGGLANLDALELANNGAGSTMAYTEVIVAEWNTIGSKVVTRVPDANGNYTAWATSGFGNVDEHVAGTDYATSGTPDQRVSYLLTDFPALGTGEVINNVRVTTSASKDGGGPSQLNHFVRISSTDYDEANIALTIAQTGVSTDFDESPATTDPWTVTELNSTEFGIRSRT